MYPTSSVEQFDFNRFLTSGSAWPMSFEAQHESTAARMFINGVEHWHALQVDEAINDLPGDREYVAPRFKELRQRANAINYIRQLIINGDGEMIDKLTSEYDELSEKLYPAMQGEPTLYEIKTACTQAFRRLIDPYVSMSEEV